MEDDSPYLRQVTALGDRQAVVTHRPVYSRNGTKLVERGVRVTSALLDKLVAHKLSPPVDACLTVENAVDGVALCEAARSLFAPGEALAALVPEATRDALVRSFLDLPLTPQLAFKLTVAREQRAELFRHGLRTGLLAHLLAREAADPRLSAVKAMTAGLVADLGILHIDPDLMREYETDDTVRKHLYAHPVAMHLVLDGMPQYSGEVGRAVLEHHERLDGSGYPRGAGGDDISPLGQLLAVADVAAALLDGSGGLPAWERLSVVLRLNRGKLNQEHARRLLLMLPGSQENEPAVPSPDAAPILETLVCLARAAQHWRTARAAAHGRGGSEPAVALIDRRMQQLEHDLADCGIDLEYWTTIDGEFGEDRRNASEVRIGANEGMWQLRQIAHEARRRWDAWQWAHAETRDDVLAWLDAVEAEH